MFTKSFIQKTVFSILILSLALSLASCGVTDKIGKKYFPDSEFNSLVVKGDAAMDRADWDKAIAAYEEAASIRPHDGELKLKQANAYERDGKLAQAFNLYQIILDSPQHSKEVLKTAKARQNNLGFKPEPVAPVKAPEVLPVDVPEKKVEKFEDKPKPAELVIPPAKDVKDVPTVEAPVAPVSKQVNIAQMQTEVQDFLNSWRDAWASKNLNRYYDHYVVTFAGDSKNTAAWRAQRKFKILVNKTIVVNLDDVVMTSIAHDQAEVSFTQQYQAGSYQDKGKKTLKLQKNNGRWQIVQESFKAQ
jgi:predicted small lipoprotein YifL/ketosteroid isomerase-like protein